MATEKSQKEPGFVTLLSPRGGERYQAGSEIQATAQITGPGQNPYLSIGTENLTLASENSTNLNKTVPLNLQGTYRLRAYGSTTEGSGYSPTISVYVHGGPDVVPGITSTVPAHNSKFLVGQLILFKASVVIPEVITVSEVKFYAKHSEYPEIIELGSSDTVEYACRNSLSLPGRYWIFARVFGTGGGSAESVGVNIDIYSSTPTGVNLTSPTNGAEFAAPASVLLQAKLEGGTEGVNFVRFFHGSTKIEDVPSNGSDTYQYNWQNLLPGTYQNVRAVVFLNDGSRLDSQNITFRVSESGSPTAVEFVTPTEDQEFTASGPIPLKVNLIGGTEGVEYVRFLYGGTKITDVYQAPYEHDWSHSIPGSYRLRAVAILTDGSRLQDEVNIRILA